LFVSFAIFVTPFLAESHDENRLGLLARRLKISMRRTDGRSQQER
jgi:hypothetical protein